ncbi:PDZ and LIM domain protein 3-like [Haliotis cracherodii]|uniref:PDZ and LIM domain protein 3-like n=1 Tax=Haliotis cracherodii TaxID=6455 RepID=UPI0039E7FDE4
MASGDVTVSLRRFDTSQPWGFKLQGGTEYGLPLFIAQVSPKSIAGTAGLQNGDGIVRIGDACANGWSHEKAKAELIRAGNDVDLTVKRGAVNTADPAVRAAGQQAASPRVELDEGSINPHMNEGSAYRDVKPKTYQILEQQLSGSTPPPSALGRGKGRQAGGGGGGAGPSSIFDRKKQERSGYLQAQGKSIQKAYGEQ